MSSSSMASLAGAQFSRRGGKSLRRLLSLPKAGGHLLIGWNDLPEHRPFRLQGDRGPLQIRALDLLPRRRASTLFFQRMAACVQFLRKPPVPRSATRPRRLNTSKCAGVSGALVQSGRTDRETGADALKYMTRYCTTVLPADPRTTPIALITSFDPRKHCLCPPNDHRWHRPADCGGAQFLLLVGSTADSRARSMRRRIQAGVRAKGIAIMCCAAQPMRQGAASLVRPSTDLPRDGVPRPPLPSGLARGPSGALAPVEAPLFCAPSMGIDLGVEVLR
jgi:hypothetical protein